MKVSKACPNAENAAAQVVAAAETDVQAAAVAEIVTPIDVLALVEVATAHKAADALAVVAEIAVAMIEDPAETADVIVEAHARRIVHVTNVHPFMNCWTSSFCQSHKAWTLCVVRSR